MTNREPNNISLDRLCDRTNKNNYQNPQNLKTFFENKLYQIGQNLQFEMKKKINRKIPTKKANGYYH